VNAPPNAAPVPAPSGAANVTDYGAIGDGQTDSTRAFQAAMSTGGHVWVPRGTYLLKQLTPVSGMTLECEDWGAILKVADNLNGGLIAKYYTEAPVSNVTIMNCQIDGNKAHNTQGSAIQFSGTHILVYNNYIHDTAYAAVNLGRPSGADDMAIVDNHCENPALPGNFWGCYAFTGGTNLVMSGNTATSSDHAMAYAYDVEPNPGWTVSNVTIRDNTAIGGFLQVKGGNGGITRDVHILNNSIDATGAAGWKWVLTAIYVQGVEGIVEIAGNQAIPQ